MTPKTERSNAELEAAYRKAMADLNAHPESQSLAALEAFAMADMERKLRAVEGQ